MRYELVAMSVVSALASLVLPLVLGLVLRRRMGTRWWLFVLGALSFIASQVVHLPLVFGVDAAVKAWMAPPPPSWWWFTPLSLGLLAGICEEPARFIALRWVLRREEDRGREGALMLGAGHGGIEAMFVGVAVALALVNLVVLREVDVAGMRALSLGQIDEAAAQATVDRVRAYWDGPLWVPLLSPFERLIAVSFHVSMSALVAHGVRTRALWPLALAIALHTGMDALAVAGASRWSPLAIELVLAAAVLPVAAAVIVWTWRAAGPTPRRAPVDPATAERPREAASVEAGEEGPPKDS